MRSRPNVGIHESVAHAEAHLESIDVEDGEYQFFDDTRQPYFAEVL